MARRLDTGWRPDADAIRKVTQKNPDLQRVIGDLAARGDKRAAEKIRFLVARMVQDVADAYLGPVIARLDRIAVLRENIAAILDNVLEGRPLHPDIDVADLGKHFDALHKEMTELDTSKAPVEDQLISLTGNDALVYAQSLLDEFAQGPLSGGRHVQPDLTAAIAQLSPQQRKALREAAKVQAKPGEKRKSRQSLPLQRAWFSETEGEQLAAIRELADSGQLSATMMDDLRTAIETVSKARSRALQDDRARVAQALRELERLADPRLADIVARSNDVWVVRDMAMHNPAALAHIWQLYMENAGKKGKNLTPSGFRAYLQRWMTQWGRSTFGEFTAAFTMRHPDTVLLKAPDYQPMIGGIDMIGLTHDGWTELIDDKSYTKKGAKKNLLVTSVTALDKNLIGNLVDDITEIRTAIASRPPQASDLVPPHRVTDAISAMEAAVIDLRRIDVTKPGWEIEVGDVLTRHKIRRVVTSAAGEVDDVSGPLRAAGFGMKPTGIDVELPPRGKRQGP